MRTALTSFPRSGNTWLRHLIFNASGQRSAYELNPETDVVHHAAAIPLVADDNATLVKTHGRDAGPYDAAIHLVRHPYNAIASYLDYCRAFDVPIQRRGWFIQVESKGWANHSEYWRMAHEAGVIDFYHPIQYEMLVTATETSLRAILNDFLGGNVSSEDIKMAVDECSLERMQEKGSDKFYAKGSQRDYEKTLRESEIAQIKEICGPEMAHWNYT